MTLLVADRLTKVYEIDRVTFNAVSDVSLRLERGDFASVIGHSGSGKTTLLSIVGGIAAPSAGRVLFKDTDIYSLGSDGLSGYRCADIGFIFQFASLLPMLTARENLLLPVSFSERGDRASAEKRAAELLAKVGLGDKVNAYPSQLSGGQQRRVAIARAFMNEPELILADEPTGDLDEDTEAEMMEFFDEMNRLRGTTFLLVTHNTDLAKKTKRRFRMQAGVIQEISPDS